jgi:catechol 2,3-dioxygenase-like lactoylglutathione lyase family enzyme
MLSLEAKTSKGEMMKLNHLNLIVEEVQATSDFLKKYFGLRNMQGVEGSDKFALLLDDDDLVLGLFKGEEVNYPGGFHFGFMRETREQVNNINQHLKEDGFNVKPPRDFHGSYTFYFKTPFGLTLEVLC